MESASFENSARSENELFPSENGGEVLANRALKRILSPKRGTRTKLFTKLYNEELHSFCSSADISRVMKSRKARSGGHVLCVHGVNSCGDLKGGEVLDQSNDCYRCKTGRALWSYFIFYLFRVTRY
jgi:hypothetical protein